ncbi:MAG TPA: MerR family transcriptional regulator [Paenibacillaceae bacterium]
MADDSRDQMALFPIGTVMKLTGLSARQIRYYEEHDLVRPIRTAGNQRLFSFRDVERLRQIKSMLESGLNIAGIKKVLQQGQSDAKEGTVTVGQPIREGEEITDPQVHRILKRQLMDRRPGKVTLIEGQLAGYFRNPQPR